MRGSECHAWQQLCEWLCREADTLLASAGRLLARPAQLPHGRIETTRLRDANIAEPSKAVVQSIEFHPHDQVLMTAGMDKRLRFFQASLPNTHLARSLEGFLGSQWRAHTACTARVAPSFYGPLCMRGFSHADKMVPLGWQRWGQRSQS